MIGQISELVNCAGAVFIVISLILGSDLILRTKKTLRAIMVTLLISLLMLAIGYFLYATDFLNVADSMEKIIILINIEHFVVAFFIMLTFMLFRYIIYKLEK